MKNEKNFNAIHSMIEMFLRRNNISKTDVMVAFLKKVIPEVSLKFFPHDKNALTFSQYRKGDIVIHAHGPMISSEARLLQPKILLKIREIAEHLGPIESIRIVGK